MSLQARVGDLVEHLKQGKILEAMDEFYAENLSMQENANEPTVGLAANIEREKVFLSSVKEWKGLEVTNVSASESGDGSGVSFIEYHFDFINTEDQPVHYEQVARQEWSNGKITSERFYYNAGG